MYKSFVGRLLFWVCWPLIWIYAPLFLRSRVLVVCDGKFLAVKGWFGPNTWQLPGGGKKFRESNREAAVRELFEETGLKVDTEELMELYGSTSFTSRGLTIKNCCYLIEYKKEPIVHLNNRELTAHKWFKLDIEQAGFSPHVTEALRVFATERGKLVE